MKKLLFISFILLNIFTQQINARTVEVDVHGMTCSFCVDSLERAFGKMKDVSKVDVSLKMKKIRLETNGETPSIETIKQTVLNSGFTPTKVSVVSDETSK